MTSITKKKLKKRKTNPNKVNQYTGPDPRQALFLSLYLDPKSQTFSNARASALSAGYEETYANVITKEEPVWLSENLRLVRRQNLFQKAERNLDTFLDMDIEQPLVGKKGIIYEGKGKDKRPIVMINPKLAAIKEKASEFVSETLGKVHYSKGNNNFGVAIQINNIQGDKESYA